MPGADPGIYERGGGGPSSFIRVPFPASFPLSVSSPLEVGP